MGPTTLHLIFTFSTQGIPQLESGAYDKEWMESKNKLFITNQIAWLGNAATSNNPRSHISDCKLVNYTVALVGVL